LLAFPKRKVGIDPINPAVSWQCPLKLGIKMDVVRAVLVVSMARLAGLKAIDEFYRPEFFHFFRYFLWMHR
jgi:hypothetical protein